MKPSAVLNSIDIAREDQNFPALVALLSTATDGSQAEAICRAIEDLASLPEQLELQGRAGAPQAVVAAMKRFPGELGLPSRACATISRLVYNHAPNQTLCGDAGGCEAVTVAMQECNADNRALAFRSIHAIVRLLWNHPGNQQRVRFGGLTAKTILATMRFFETDKEVVGWGCMAISLWSPVEVAEDFSRLRGCETVMEVLNRFGVDDCWLALRACQAIEALSTHSEANRRLFVTLGAIQSAKTSKENDCKASVVALLSS